ncbi:MAG: hypothetical protein AB7S75_16735 [Desulfococcaceae bacterium]
MSARLFCVLGLCVLLFTFASCSDSDNTCENKILRKSIAEWDNDKDGNIDSIIYYTYDSEGNLLTEETDSDNDETIDFVTENRYEGSLLKKKIFNENDNGVYEIWEYFYDNNRLISINAEGSYTIISPDKPESSGSFHIIYTFVYDESGNIIAKNAVNPDNGSVDSVFSYEYDLNGNVIKELIDYNNDGEFESVTVTNYIYDNCGYMAEAHIDIDDDGVIDKSGYYTWE